MNCKLFLIFIFLIFNAAGINAQVIQSTIVKPADNVGKIPKTPAATLPIVKVPEINLVVNQVTRSSTSATSNVHRFDFTATFKNLTNFQTYRWLIEEYNTPPKPLCSYRPIPPDSARTGFTRDSSKIGSVKIWCEALAPNSPPLSSNKVIF